MIRDAEYVIADSFHATAFSIQFHKKFISFYPEKASMRIRDILSKLDIPQRGTKGEVTIRDIEKDIDYETIDKKLNAYRVQDNASQVTVIHNAIEKFDDEVVVDKTLKKLKEDGFYLVGNVGRFAEQKGMEYFIKSYPMIKKKTDRIKYILIGDGVDREKLKSLVNQLGIQEEVIFLGFRRDVQNVLSQVDLLVLSSLWEGLPLTPIEGFSVGKTVVATAVDGTVEVVDDSKNGYLIPAKNSEKIAEKVLYLFEHPETQKQLEREAYRTFQNEFSFEKFSEKVLNYYEKC